jgi:hypothetical protein
MALIDIDQSLNLSEEISDFFLFLLNEDRVSLPKLSIPQILLAKARPGLSSEILSSSIISRFPEIGIPTGPLVGGAANVMEAYTKAFVEEFIDAIQNDMRVDVVTDAGATVSVAGANGGGPVVSVGATVAPFTGVGVAS